MFFARYAFTPCLKCMAASIPWSTPSTSLLRSPLCATLSNGSTLCSESTHFTYSSERCSLSGRPSRAATSDMNSGPSPSLAAHFRSTASFSAHRSWLYPEYTLNSARRLFSSAVASGGAGAAASLASSAFCFLYASGSVPSGGKSSSVGMAWLPLVPSS